MFTKKEKVLLGAMIVLALIIAILLFSVVPSKNQAQPIAPVQDKNIISSNQIEEIKNESIKAIKIDPQSLGNLPWGSMSGSLTRQEIESITGIQMENLQGQKVHVVNWSGTRFKKIGFVIDQSYDPKDRKVYWADNVDVQRYNAFGINSRDDYVFEGIGEIYISRDNRGRICFFGYKPEESGEQSRIQSFVNVPWQNLSGNIPLETVAQKLSFNLQGLDYYYNPEKEADSQIMSYNASTMESRVRGCLVASHGRLEQAIFSYNGKIYEARDIQIQSGDYPEGVNPIGATPPFRLLTIRAGKPEEKVFVLLFYDKDENLVSAMQTKNRLDGLLSSGVGSGGTSTFSSSPGGGNPGNIPGSGVDTGHAVGGVGG
jgi:hypothetical protein